MRGFVPTPAHIVDEMVASLFRGRSPTPQDKILDSGCGTGVFLQGIVRWCRSKGCELPRLIGVESEPGRAEAARRALADHAQAEVRQSDFLTGAIESFDFVISNPPYVPITCLSEQEKNDFRAVYETARGRFDLYLLFFERALKCLKPGGRLVFITPEKFLYVETAAPFRRLLSRVQVEQIRLVDERIFGGLVAYPTITTIVNHRPTKPTLVQHRDGTKIRVALSGNGASWMSLIQPAVRAEADAATLEDICDRISCGVATGADSVFVRPAHTLDPSLRRFAYPTIAGRELCEPGCLRPSKHVMLIPYDRIGLLLEQQRLRGLGEYLSQSRIRERLLGRTCVRRKPWYAFHETPMLTEILRPKILCKDIAQSPHFWIDRNGDLVPRHSVYYIVPKDSAALDRLCAYLNTGDVAAWLASHCQRAANGFLRLQSNVLKSLPVPPELGQTRRLKKRQTRRNRERRSELPGLFVTEAIR